MGKKTDPNTFLCVLVFPGRTFKHVIAEQQLPQGQGKPVLLGELDPGTSLQQSHSQSSTTRTEQPPPAWPGPCQLRFGAGTVSRSSIFVLLFGRYTACSGHFCAVFCLEELLLLE